MVASVLSSDKNRAVPCLSLVFGEVGLTGEVRAVTMAAQRVAEAARLGYEQCILPYANAESLKKNDTKTGGIRLMGVRKVRELLGVLEG